MDRSGNEMPIESVSTEITDTPVTVYNFQVEENHTYFVGDQGILVHNAEKYETNIGDYKGDRTQEQYEDLTKDPAHQGSENPYDIAQGELERNVGLSLEKGGRLKNIIRDPSGKAEFIEDFGNGEKWDVKSFNSNYAPRKGGFKLENAMKRIIEEIFEDGENVIVDTTNMSPQHISELINEIISQNLTDHVIFWP